MRVDDGAGIRKPAVVLLQLPHGVRTVRPRRHPARNCAPMLTPVACVRHRRLDRLCSPARGVQSVDDRTTDSQLSFLKKCTERTAVSLHRRRQGGNCFLAVFLASPCPCPCPCSCPSWSLGDAKGRAAAARERLRAQGGQLAGLFGLVPCKPLFLPLPLFLSLFLFLLPPRPPVYFLRFFFGAANGRFAASIFFCWQNGRSTA